MLHAHRPAIASLLVCGLLALAVAGCAPKRVTHHAAPAEPREEAAKPTHRDEFSPAADDLPAPRARGRAGEAGRERDSSGTSDLGDEAARLARGQLGKAYQWGAAGPDKFDCSGLVCYVYGSLDVPLPRVSRDQAKAGDEVARNGLQPGDLLFFATEGKGINHVGIYIGHSEFVHAPRRHVPVRTDSLNDSYWNRSYRTARRVT